MATFKFLIIPDEPNKVGKFQIYLQVTHASKSLLIGMKHTIEKENWMQIGKNGVVKLTNNTHLNNLLASRELDAGDLVIDWEKVNKKYTSKDIKAELLVKWAMQKEVATQPAPIEIPLIESVPETSVKAFNHYADLHIKNMKDAGNRNYMTDQSRINHFKAFIGNKDIEFDKITTSFLDSYKSYLKANLKTGKLKQKPISERTVQNHLLVIRTLYNKAVNDDIVAKGKNYPFGKGKIVIKFPETTKIGLNQAEVRKLEGFASQLPEITDFSFIHVNKVNNGLNQKLFYLRKKNPLAELCEEDKARLAEIQMYRNFYLKHALNLWLLSFYFAGIRFSDLLLLKWSDFEDNRLYYTMGKNNKTVSIKISSKVENILKQYRSGKRNHGLVFYELDNLPSLSDNLIVKTKISNADGRVNDALEKIRTILEITKKISMHHSRHSFGFIAKKKISVQDLQILYRHSDLSTTVAYQGNFIHDETDDALDKVIGLD